MIYNFRICTYLIFNLSSSTIFPLSRLFFHDFIRCEYFISIIFFLLSWRIIQIKNRYFYISISTKNHTNDQLDHLTSKLNSFVLVRALKNKTPLATFAFIFCFNYFSLLLSILFFVSVVFHEALEPKESGKSLKPIESLSANRPEKTEKKVKSTRRKEMKGVKGYVWIL